MPTTMQPIRENIKGRELPKSLRQRANIGPEGVVTITIQPKTDDLLEDMLDILEKSGVEAKSRGLTDDTVSDLLKNES